MRVPAFVFTLAAVAMTLLPGTGTAQDLRARFAIVAANDSTFDIVLADARWVKKGMTGVVIDPREKDQAVARFRVVGVEGLTAHAAITGMTSAIASHHMAALIVPRKRWYAEKAVWIGTALGAALGFFIGQR